MQKDRYIFPATGIIVEVSKSPLDRPEPGNRYTIFNCKCRGVGPNTGGFLPNRKAPRNMYQITAPEPAAAARMAMDFYHKDYFGDGKENE